ncbi:DUF4190 domain-containing protein [Actinomycetospora termitidis]|uniref:DUF4190 domain-containing protein n=1 Tax=Actinomycetospora termitidis TaxID=3053470 RepID=A0ABT7MB69_9PSEU|nr:DUF4190 domain-containing protein [Actinomycetospora sp. Odt1-22]MDL5157878.1 DUF4190 domain-containing protein [Actinomycetospora sp. Odt1-22]
MTQQADPRAPMIDTSVDADVTTPAGGTPVAPPSGWPPPGAIPQQQGYGQPGPTTAMPVPPPAGPMVQPPLNTLSWLSVVSAFVVSPVAIVLGAISRRQIARTGERGKGLATTGIALGIVFTIMGIVSTIMVLSMVTTVTYTPAPAPVAAAPVPAASVPSAPVTGGTGTTGTGTTAGGATGAETAGRAQLLSGWLDVAAADATLSENLDQHSGDLDAIKADVATYRDELQRFRDTASTVQLSPELRSQVDSRMLPAVDQVLTDLNTIVSSSSSSKVQAAASALSDDATAMANEVTAVIGG